MDNNPIAKIDGLDNSTLIYELHLANCRIEKIEGLEKLTDLVYLDLSGNKITKIEDLDNLKKLGFLNLEKNNIKRIEGLHELDSLEIDNLLLKDNPIEEIVRRDLQFLRSKGLPKDSWLEQDIQAGKIKVVEE